VIRCELEAGKLTHNGRRYAVYHEGKLLIKSTRDPEYAACRVLRDQGYTGKVGYFTKGGTQLRSSINDLIAGAGLTTVDPNKGIPYVTKHTPFKR
jgi:hypothetical protein